MTDKTDLAEDRTDWAEDRTLLANERTFAGWMRTGLAAVGVALGLKALFGSFEPTWIPKAVSSVYVCVGVLIFWAAWSNARRTTARLDEHATSSQSTARLSLIAGTMAAASAATGAILWFL
jgi:putative membrane protein